MAARDTLSTNLFFCKSESQVPVPHVNTVINFFDFHCQSSCLIPRGTARLQEVANVAEEECLACCMAVHSSTKKAEIDRVSVTN